jgi:hypothetical protein
MKYNINMSFKKTFIGLSTGLLLGTTACQDQKPTTIKNSQTGKIEINCGNSDIQKTIELARKSTSEKSFQEGIKYGGYSKDYAQLVVPQGNGNVEGINVRITKSEAAVEVARNSGKQRTISGNCSIEQP